VPPSATAVVPSMLRVVVWMVSVTAVTAALSLTVSCSKLPPVVPVMVAETLAALMYTSLAGAATVTVPVVLPASIWITAPLLRVTVMAVSALLVKVAV